MQIFFVLLIILHFLVRQRNPSSFLISRSSRQRLFYRKSWSYALQPHVNCQIQYDNKHSFQHYILLLMMKLSICGLLCLLLLSSTVFAQNSEPTTLTYFVQYEQEQDDDYIQIQLLIQSQSPQLTLALNQAKKIASEVAAIAQQFCKQYNKKGKEDCKQAVEIENFEIEPQYQQVRKENVFTAFVVSHEVLINVYSPENIGYLVDNLLKFQDLTIKGFEWLPLKQKDSEQEAIKEGVEQGQNLCKQIGQFLGRIVDIEEVIDDKQQEQNKGEQDEEDQQQEVEITTYKFQVQCAEKKAKK